MGARRGQDYIAKLRSEPRNIYHHAQKVEDVTTHPAFRHGVQNIAALYDLQWERPDEMLFPSPTTGDKVGRSFLMARTHDELYSVSRMIKTWADYSFGMLGRAPDHLSRSFTAFAAGAEFLGEVDKRFAENARAYHTYLRENDLCLTHTLINPQINRAVGPAQQSDPFLAARIKEETDAGIVIRGARMLATLPMADEILVFPSTLLKGGAEDAPYAYALAVPCTAPGLKFLCRETLDYGGNVYDHPFGARFEEMDAVVIFDDVFVPWERVFMYRDVAHCNKAWGETGAVGHMAHQVAVKNVAKTEYLLGLASLLVDAIGIEGFQHVQEKVTEIWVNLEVMKALLRTAEVDAQLDRWGIMRPAWEPLDAARNLYPRLYPRMIEIIQQLGASGLIAMPTHDDLVGPLASDVQRYYAAARVNAHDRIPLFRLAWDTALSAFGSRQLMYERFFFGDPVRMAGAAFNGHDRTVYMDRVRSFLARAEAEAQQDLAELESANRMSPGQSIDSARLEAAQ
jgi:4-hydroxyphenylacetate 3-monooxygenase